MKEPLSLPRGSVRAILTILLLVFVGVSMYVPVVPGAAEVRGALLALAGMAVKSYWDTREKQNEQDGPPLGDPYVREE